jgi:tyrosyl-DNA phosphodiesterase 2
MLQEVIETTEAILRGSLSNVYEFFSGKLYTEYYTMILVRKKNCECSNKNLINFENSTMGRNLLIVKLNYMKLVDICVMTSHLESTADFAKQRIEQLRRCIKEVENQQENCLVFFGGLQIYIYRLNV